MSSCSPTAVTSTTTTTSSTTAAGALAPVTSSSSNSRIHQQKEGKNGGAVDKKNNEAASSDDNSLDLYDESGYHPAEDQGYFSALSASSTASTSTSSTNYITRNGNKKKKKKRRGGDDGRHIDKSHNSNKKVKATAAGDDDDGDDNGSKYNPEEEQVDEDDVVDDVSYIEGRDYVLSDSSDDSDDDDDVEELDSILKRLLSGDETVVEDALRSFYLNNKKAYCRVFGRMPGSKQLHGNVNLAAIATIVHVMKKHDTNSAILKQGVLLLSSFDGIPWRGDCFKIMKDFEVIELTAAAMAMVPADESFQEAACKVVTSTVKYMYSRDSHRVVQSGAFPVMHQAMTRFHNNDVISEQVRTFLLYQPGAAVVTLKELPPVPTPTRTSTT